MSINGEPFQIKSEGWEKRANCVGTDPEIFFPEPSVIATEARKVCSNCVVRLECLDFALRNHIHDGIYGGFSEKERKRLARGEKVEFKVYRRQAVTTQLCTYCGGEFEGSVMAAYCCTEHRRAAEKLRAKARKWRSA